MKNKIWLLGICALLLVGCATSSSYVQYTFQHYVPKDKAFVVNVYPVSQPLDASRPYYVIGKVAVEGFASSGVSPETLTHQAKEIARRRGADAIINASTQILHYYNGDALLRFKGELIVYAADGAR